MDIHDKHLVVSKQIEAEWKPYVIQTRVLFYIWLLFYMQVKKMLTFVPSRRTRSFNLNIDGYRYRQTKTFKETEYYVCVEKFESFW